MVYMCILPGMNYILGNTLKKTQFEDVCCVLELSSVSMPSQFVVNWSFLYIHVTLTSPICVSCDLSKDWVIKNILKQNLLPAIVVATYTAFQ
jgi:hypothetical protein